MKCHSCKKAVCGLILDGENYVCGPCIIAERDRVRKQADAMASAIRAFRNLPLKKYTKLRGTNEFCGLVDSWEAFTFDYDS